MDLLTMNVLIIQTANKWGIDPCLLKAVVETESDYRINCARYERDYPWLHNLTGVAKKLKCTRDTMKMIQSTSWGLCQCMGALFFEYGSGGWPADLCEPSNNLNVGARHLKSKVRRYGNDPGDVYAAFNAGSVRKTREGLYVNQRNVTRFLKIYFRIKDEERFGEI